MQLSTSGHNGIVGPVEHANKHANAKCVNARMHKKKHISQYMHVRVIDCMDKYITIYQHSRPYNMYKLQYMNARMRMSQYVDI